MSALDELVVAASCTPPTAAVGVDSGSTWRTLAVQHKSSNDRIVVMILSIDTSEPPFSDFNLENLKRLILIYIDKNSSNKLPIEGFIRSELRLT